MSNNNNSNDEVDTTNNKNNENNEMNKNHIISYNNESTLKNIDNNEIEYEGSILMSDITVKYWGILNGSNINFYLNKNDINNIPYEAINLSQFKYVTKCDTDNSIVKFGLQLVFNYGNKARLFVFEQEENRNKWYEALTKIMKRANIKRSGILVINDNKFKLECRYLNEDVNKQYTVVKIINAFHIFTSQDANEKEEFVTHIRQCQWIRISFFSIFLYKIQMKHTKKFVSEIMAKNHILKTEEMKASQMNDCNYSNTNIGVKREWNDTLNHVNDICWDNINELDAMNKIEEPSLKRRKLSHSNGDRKETKGAVKNMNADIESKKQEIAQLWGIQISDIEEKLSLLSSIIIGVSNVILLDYLRECDLNIQSATNYHFSHSLSGSNTKEQEDTDSDIEIIPTQDIQVKQSNIKHYSHNNSNKQLQLTEIESIILYKSAKKCQSLLQLDHSEYISRKQIIVESIQKFGQDLFEWKEPNDSQYNAICKSISSPVSIIHGPPGTGKTLTSAQIINAIMVNNLLEHNRKIFVCAYTHTAINELLQKISVYVSKDVILRLGDKDKCPKAVRKYCLQQKMENYQVRNQDEKEAVWKNIFDGASIIIGTIYSVTSYPLIWFMEQHDNKVFNWLLIDECTQVMDPVLTIGVNILDHTSDSHLILIGDHKQLPPVIKSNKIKYGFKTVFET
eukprot:337035_1